MNEFIHPIAILPYILSIMSLGALAILGVANLRYHKPVTVKVKKY